MKPGAATEARTPIRNAFGDDAEWLARTTVAATRMSDDVAADTPCEAAAANAAGTAAVPAARFMNRLRETPDCWAMCCSLP